MLIYTFVGRHRDVPPGIITAAERIGEDLAVHVMRSGAANGIDSAAETGARKGGGQVEIYLPWAGFNPDYKPGQEPDRSKRRWPSQPGVIVPTQEDFVRATAEALKVWPLDRPWDRLSQGAQKLQARNTFQVLGLHLDKPSDFLLYWTENGSRGGGTGQTLRLAELHGIPCYCIGELDTGRSVMEWYRRQSTLQVPTLDIRHSYADDEDERPRERDRLDPEVGLSRFDDEVPDVFQAAGLYDD